jgi:alcohol dehydrogenase
MVARAARLKSETDAMSPSPDQLARLTEFDVPLHLQLVFGADSLGRVGQLARELGGRRVLLVTDPGIVKAGHAAKVMELLAAAGLRATCFDRVRENPDTTVVNECVVAAREANADLLIGLGGGSSMDAAKGCNFILTNGGRMQDYWGVGKATKPMLPLIAIPTTAGTGSECQSFALISDEMTHQKMACGDPKALARVAILDPGLTLSQPPRVTACTGIDALAHAVETAVTKKRNGTSIDFSHAAFRLLADSFETVLREPRNLPARAKMLLGAAFAGTAIEHSMLGAAHAAANPLTAHFGIIHGQAVGLMLPHIVRFNAQDAEAARGYASLAGSPEALAMQIELFLKLADLARPLSSLGATRDAIPALAGEAAAQWTAAFNPWPVGGSDFERLYAAAF